MSTFTFGAGIAMGFGASLVVGFGAGVTMGFGAGYSLRSTLDGPQGIAESVMEKLGFDWVDVLYLFWDPEKSARKAREDASAKNAASPAAEAVRVSSSKEASPVKHRRKAVATAGRATTKPTQATVMRRKSKTDPAESKTTPKAPAPIVRPDPTSLASIFRKRTTTHRKAA
jgi:hypothetical protein